MSNSPIPIVIGCRYYQTQKPDFIWVLVAADRQENSVKLVAESNRNVSFTTTVDEFLSIFSLYQRASVLPGQVWTSDLYPKAEATVLRVKNGWVEYKITSVPDELIDQLNYEGGVDIDEFTEFFSLKND